MKIRLPLFLTLLLSAILPVGAQPEGNLGKQLRELDRVIANREVYAARREGQFEEIKRRLAHGSLSPEERFADYGRLFNEYLSFQVDTAIHYALLKKELALGTGDSLKILETDLNLAQIYSIAGLNQDAFEILNAMSTRHFTPFLRSYYHNIYSILYENIYQSIDNPELKRHHYELLHDAYTDLLGSQSPDEDGSSYYYTKANLLNLENRHSEAREWLETNAERMKTNMREEAIYYYLLAETCIHGGGTRGEAERFYVRSAVIDLKTGIKEYVSLHRLAQMLYADGEINRAYRYLKVALEDANYCNSQKRLVKVSQLLPIIDNDYQIRRNRQQRNLYISLSFLALLVVLLIAALTYINKLYRNNRRVGLRLAALNNELKELNSHLSESNLIKQTYIVRYMDFCLSYIDQMDSRLKRIARLLDGNNRDALRKALDPAAFARENLELFYNNFDITFLKLFPSFVEEYNKLLKPSERIVLKAPDVLTTELRIYALVRLGITDSVQIAQFLHCSLSTVYNNRTSARNKACVDRSRFEHFVARIGIAEEIGSDGLK